MQIIDGYCREPNIYADDIGQYNIAVFGNGDYVLNVGEKLGYELVSNNEIRIKDGVFVTQGRRGVIKKGTMESCIIENGTLGEKRNDLIVIEYSKSESTLIETHALRTIKGVSGTTALDPALVSGDIANGSLIHQMPLYRIKLDGLNIIAVQPLFKIGGMLPETIRTIEEISKVTTAGLIPDALAVKVINEAIEIERKRIDNMIINSGSASPDNAELADLRVDIKGNVHPSSGEAVRNWFRRKITPFRTAGFLEWDSCTSGDVEHKKYTPKFTDLYPSCGVTENAYCSKDIPGNYAAKDGYVSIHKIAAVANDIIRIDGANFDDEFCRIRVSQDDGSTCMSLPVGTDPWNEWVSSGNIKKEDDVWYIKLRNHQGNTDYVEFSFRPKNDEKGVHISKNQAISYEIKTEIIEGEENYTGLRLLSEIGIPGLDVLRREIAELQSGTGVVGTIPDYVQKNIDSMCARMEAFNDPNIFTFGYMTDIHANAFELTDKTIHDAVRRSVQAINAINRRKPIKLLAAYGDMLWNNSATSKADCLKVYEELNNIFRRSSVPVFIGKGNHDDNTLGTYANSILNAERYSALGRHYEDNLTADAGNVEKSYGYKDFPSYKIRMIFVNSSDIPYIKGFDGDLKYRGQYEKAVSNEQLQFIAKALKFTEQGWGVIFVTHHSLYNNTGITEDKGYDGYVPNEHGGDALRGIINAYKTKGAYKKTSKLTDFNYSVDVNYAGNASNELICIISGHTHRDLSAKENGTLLLSTAAACTGMPTENADGSIIDKVAGTSNETSWDLISIDRKNHKIYTTRYGAGKNREYTY